MARRSGANTAILVGCILFDAAVLLSFINVFSLFSVLAPLKSLVMLFVLAIGLLILNGVVAFPRLLARKFGNAYAIALSGAGLLYGGAANVLSILLIDAATITYVTWELLLLSIFLLFCGIIGYFSRRRELEARRHHRERASEGMTWALLLEIEELLRSKNTHGAYKPLVQSFDRLKERIQASTPFYRITGNQEVTDLERSINERLTTLHIDASLNFSNDHADQMQDLIHEIGRLVRQREQCILKNNQR
ncbi:hypothetical protein DUZ99_15570 [Xylanibacillus composti]|uniref:Uncharacterized protein n=1 Tax=Xylanibacillus composti TaxID=1572762 RepID=A0A8J4M3R5_9BACL|nr:hypothetical protein [Xylanibacillus composti]MDT9726402.1 hypothetical protein [Xylanibacillus composti]GIQ70357.1 hypothetical protein XYCOK13_31810 [Xylanibacillus composti]